MTKTEEFNLWHYTTEEGLKGILSDKTLWASNYRYLNDSLEFTYAKEIIRRVLKPKVIDTIEGICRINSNAKKVVDSNGGIQNIADIEVNDTMDILFKSMLNPPDSPPNIFFVLSFCKVSKKDNFKQKNGLLSQWRGYGKDGGYAIIFDLNELTRAFKIELNSFYYGPTGDDVIIYDTKKLSPTDDMKKYLDIICDYAYRVCESRLLAKTPPLPKYAEVEALFACMGFLKHKGFEEEDEYRFCVMPRCKEWQNSEYFEYDEKKRFKEIKIRNNRGNPVPYIRLFERSTNLPIKEIRVGPHPEKESRVKSIEIYLKSIGLNGIKVFCSEIPYIGSK